MTITSSLPVPAPSPRSQTWPLSFTQEGMWLHDQIAGGRFTNGVSFVLRFSGPVDIPVLLRAADIVVRRHPQLRAGVVVEGGQPRHTVVNPVHPVDIATVAVTHDERIRLPELLRRSARQPFDLSRPPIRIRLFWVGPEDATLLVTIHHLACDGRSVELLKAELVDCYRALSGHERLTPAPTADPRTLVLRQRQALTEERRDRLVQHWKRQLSDVPLMLALPTDHRRPLERSYRGGIERFWWAPSTTRDLTAFARTHQTTLYSVLLAAWQVLLHRCTGQDRFVVGTPVSTRDTPAAEQVVGCFIDTAVIPSDLSGDPTFVDLVARTSDSVVDAVDHLLPFPLLCQAVGSPSSTHRPALAEVMFVLQGPAGTDLALPGLRVSTSEIHDDQARFDLALQVEPVGDRLLATFEYAADLFDASTIRRMGRHLQVLVADALHDPDRTCSALSLLDPHETAVLLEDWSGVRNPPAAQGTIPDHFARQCQAAPDRIAVVDGDRQVTYRQLADRAAAIAHRLQAVGVGPGSVVAVCLPRSADLVASLLAVLQVGGAYLSLDVSYPPDRLQLMVDDSGAQVLLSNVASTDLVPQTAELVVVDSVPADPSAPGGPLRAVDPPAVDPGDVAYVIYTSGSTGRPKGAALTHAGVVNLVADGTSLRFGPESVVLQVSPLSFDPSVLEIWGALLNGGRLVLYPPEMPTADRIGAIVRDQGVTTMVLVTSLFHEVVDADVDALAGLRQLLVGGDVLSATHAQRALAALPQLELLNAYGPTEATVLATQQVIDLASTARPAPLSIGRPIAGARTYVLDPHLQPVPIGVFGQLYLGGCGVAAGYLHRPDLTEQRFAPDPFEPQARGTLYATGDTVRWRADGTLEFAGRDDGQVKIRGFRVELGEVEQVLRGHPRVADCVVTATDAGLGRTLTAYLVPAGTPVPEAELRTWAGQRLPRHMAPTAWCWLDRLPRSPSGKVDREALPAVQQARNLAPAAPRDSLEITLLHLWRTILDTPNLGVTDDFFAVGGHSLAALQLVAAIRRELDATISIESVFTAPTVEQMAVAVRGAGHDTRRRCLVPLQPAGTRPPIFLVHALGGTVLRYGTLAGLLRPDQPLWGLQSCGVHPDNPLDQSVEAMAERYLDEIRASRPDGPYVIGGYSCGGLVALEMAQQLRASDDPPVTLFMIDTSLPDGTEPVADWLDVVALRLIGADHVDEVRSLPLEEQLDVVLERALAAGAFPPDYSRRELRRLLELSAANDRAFNKYRPRPWDRPLRFFTTTTTAGTDLNWRAVTGPALEVVTLPGDHFSLLDQHATTLADELRTLTDAARIQPNTQPAPIGNAAP